MKRTYIITVEVDDPDNSARDIEVEADVKMELACCWHTIEVTRFTFKEVET